VPTMLDYSNSRRDELLDRAAAFAAGRKGTAGPPGEQAGELLRYFYRHVAVEDIDDRSEVDLYGAAMS
jgi:glutamate dehydrogenase